jgi:uncharacterized protein YecT (DUF1311 family)
MIPTLLVALALQASLDARAREFHCDDPQNQMEMNVCAQIDFERADAELNAVWRQVVAAARIADREIQRGYDQRPTSEAKLREAQRAWIIFRDAHCTVQGYDEARGGSMEPMVYGACRAELTRQRIAQLRALSEQ